MQWKNEYRTGISEIDAQHKELFNYGYSLEQYLDGEDSSKLLTRFSAYQTLMKHHFEDEETFLEKINYPMREKHKEHHNFIMDEFGKIFQEILVNYEQKRDKDKKTIIKDRFLIFEQSHLIKHVFEEDRKFVTFYGFMTDERNDERDEIESNQSKNMSFELKEFVKNSKKIIEDLSSELKYLNSQRDFITSELQGLEKRYDEKLKKLDKTQTERLKSTIKILNMTIKTEIEKVKMEIERVGEEIIQIINEGQSQDKEQQIRLETSIEKLEFSSVKIENIEQKLSTFKMEILGTVDSNTLRLEEKLKEETGEIKDELKKTSNDLKETQKEVIKVDKTVASRKWLIRALWGGLLAILGLAIWGLTHLESFIEILKLIKGTK